MSHWRNIGSVSGHPRGVGPTRLTNEDGAGGGGGDVVTMDEQLYAVESIPNGGVPGVGNCTYVAMRAWDVTIATDKNIHHSVRLECEYVLAGGGDTLLIFPAPLGLPFVLGVGQGTIVRGFTFNEVGGPMSGATLQITPGDIDTQSFQVTGEGQGQIGETYTATFDMHFLN